jgi:hypothetical protein
MDEEALHRRLLDMTVGSSGKGFKKLRISIDTLKWPIRKLISNKGTWPTGTLVPLN